MGLFCPHELTVHQPGSAHLGAPGPAAPYRPIHPRLPALASRWRARRDSPPAGDLEAAPPAAPACQRSCSGRLGEGGRLPRPEPTKSRRGKAGGPFFPSGVPTRSRLPVCGGAQLPAGPSRAPRCPRWRHPAPHADPGSASARPVPRSPAPAARLWHQAHPRAAGKAGGGGASVSVGLTPDREPAPGYTALFFFP